MSFEAPLTFDSVETISVINVWAAFKTDSHKLFKAIRKSRTLDQYQNAATAALSDVATALNPANDEDQEII